MEAEGNLAIRNVGILPISTRCHDPEDRDTNLHRREKSGTL